MSVTWAIGEELDTVNVVVDEGASELAYVSRGYEHPLISVWQSSARTVVQADPLDPVVEPPPDCADLTAELSLAALEVVADHGVWLGEINGLEVARVGVRHGECAIDIGVGAHDQFASAAINPDGDPAEALRRVAELVRPHRIAGAPAHSLGRLVRARWLRAQAIRDAAVIGLDRLAPVPMLNPRLGLKETQPAVGLGSANDLTVLVVFVVGIDLAVSEVAAGLLQYHRADEVLVVLPERDHHHRIVESVEALSVPARVLTLEGEWSD